MGARGARGGDASGTRGGRRPAAGGSAGPLGHREPTARGAGRDAGGRVPGADGGAPQVLATLRNVVLGVSRRGGVTNLGAALRQHAWQPGAVLSLLGLPIG
jgi:hypothetical protein